ncbi:laminin subunit alpha-2-like [Glandiceps talaboti]
MFICDCERTGGSCDSVTGECICPPNTIGLRCEQCAANSWGHHPVEGCKLCNCSEDGSSSLQCDSSTGQCDCKADYRGQMCNQCLFGYRDFPKCRECKCSEAGTEPSSCNDDGLCECLDDGQCECKANVASKRCTKCADNAFGFREDLSTGCTQCFCFGITQECHQADYVREQLTVTPATNAFFISDDRSVFQTQTGVLFTPAEVRLNASGPLEEIQFTSNLYWNLPQAFLGNKITSYGGRLRYTVQFFGQDVGEDDVLDIIIKGRDFSLVKPLPNPFSGIPMSYDLELLENEWELRDAIFLDYAPRDLFMMVLYDIQAIMIRATYGPDTEGAVLSDLSVEIGIPKSDDPSLPEAMDIEECACPEGYQGLSCQECAPGYVRVSNGPYLGSCRPCTCNNHGQMCDSSTGICEDCQDNTYGPMCEFCEDGYYGNATNGNEDDCKPCACPRVESSNNFSPTCEFHSDGGHLCTNCKAGYVGRHCESCDEGYFGEPSVLGGRCELCDCNTHGSLSQTCDPVTGQCECEEGISGRACDVCQHRHILTQQGCHSCDDTCTGLLLDEVAALTALLTAPNITGIVPAPWPRLRSLINATEFLEPKLESYKNALEGAAQLVNSLPNGIDGLQENVTEMLQRSVDVKMAASETADHASASNMRADDVELLLNNTLDKLKDLIQNLEELADSISSGQPALETEALLMEAQKILDEMLARDFSQQDQAAVDELDLAKEALRKTQRRFMDKVNENMALADRINGSIMDLVDKFSELIDLSQDVQGTLDEVAQNNTDMKNLLSELQLKLKNMMDSEGEMVSMLDMGRQLLEDATDLLAEGYRVLEQTMVESDDLAASLPDLRIKAGLLQQNMDDLPDLVTRAEQHADQLAEFADMLEDLFQGTRDLAEIPVKAAKVYDEIVDTVMDANITAHEAKMLADEALKQASDSTGIDDSLEDRAKNSKLRSQNLHGDAMAKDSDVDALEGRLTTVRQDIETIKSTSQEAEEKLRAIKAEIPNLPTDLSNRAQDALQKAEEALGRAATAKQKTEDVEDALPTQQDKFTELSDNTEMIGNDLDTSERSLDRTKASLGQLLDLTDRLTFKAAGIRSLQALMANNITSIKEKIAQAKNQANSIKISVDTSATCIRGYSPNVLPSFYNTIVIHFKTTQANNMVLYLGSVTNNDFMSLETLGGKVKFQWDVGAGVGFVTHPLSVDNDKWYKVEANRYGPAGELAVQLATSNIEPEIVRGKAPSEYSILDVNPDSDLYIGGIPADYENNALSVKSFAGCVGETLINEERVGLFNFKESGGDCTGCVESPGPSPTADTYQFDGSGYAIMPKIRNWNTESTTIQFSFRSFDENALLFYVTDDKKDFMSIELNDGRIAFRYDLGGGVAELISPAKYNSGDWVRVSARRGRQNGILTVEGANVAQGASPGNLKGLSINEFMYFGGTPIETADSVVSHSLTGCMRDILVNLNAQELNVENVGLLGVEDGCIQKPIRNAGLMGNGYVEMPPANLGTDGAITISFATLQPNALVLVAQDMNSRRRRQINADASGVYYSIMLHDGRVQIQVNAGKGELLLSTRKSAGTFNDGEFHVASIVKEGKNVRLTVDDLASRGGNLPDDDVIEVNRMFVGGVSEEAQDGVGGAAEVIIPFGGCVQDLVVDGVLQDLAKTTGFERANLAHCMPLSEIDIPPPVTAMPTPVDLQLPTTIASIVTPDGESCYQPSTPRTSANTAQFGKSANSHLEFAVAAKSINKEFDITVEVRTFASTGVIFYVGTAGNGQGDFASLQLVDGKPLFSFDNGAGALRLSSNVAVNDGEWHSIVLTRNRRTGTVAVDGGDEVRDRAPEGASSMDIKTSLFIGGVSESLAVPRLEQVVNSLDSCIRKFQISGTTIDLAAPLASVDVTPCYRQVENGAYFEGNGYAVLDETFRVGPDMVISLEFRTTQNNGVILSVANERNDCFGLELVNGQLALRANNGAGMFEAVFTSESEYTLCDNRWHTVKAYKIKNALELIVDDEYTGGGTQEISSSADTNNPLYLGGYPDTALAQKALTIADKFVGCIRNIEIQDTVQDLSQAPELVNVRPNSCPFV